MADRVWAGLGWVRSVRGWAGFGVLLFLELPLLAGPGEGAGVSELTTVGGVLGLSREAAAAQPAVQLVGTVSCVDREAGLIFVEDGTGGIYVHGSHLEWGWALEQRVEVVGRAGPGRYAPIVQASSIRELGPGVLSAARKVTPTEVREGLWDSQWVEVEGFVQAEGRDWLHWVLQVGVGGDPLRVRLIGWEAGEGRRLRGCWVRMKGVAGAIYAATGALKGFQVYCPAPRFLEVMSPSVGRVGDLPLVPSGGAGWWVAVGALGIGGWWSWRVRRRLRMQQAEMGRLMEGRQQIARDLHDGLIQSMYAIGLGVEEGRRLAEQDPGAAGALLDRTLVQVNQAIRDARSFLLGLEPEGLRGQEVRTALKSLVLTMNEARTCQIGLLVDAGCKQLSSSRTAQLLLITREALSNIVRHARARSARIHLRREGGRFRLDIEDDGCGFDPGARGGEGRGLRNLAVRARELGATLKIDSKPGAGTRLVLDIPCHGTS